MMNQALKKAGSIICLVNNYLCEVVLFGSIVVSGWGGDAVTGEYADDLLLQVGRDGTFVAGHALVAGTCPQAAYVAVYADGGVVGKVVQQVFQSPSEGDFPRGAVVGTLGLVGGHGGRIDTTNGFHRGGRVSGGEPTQAFAGTRTGVDEAMHVAVGHFGVVERLFFLHGHNELMVMDKDKDLGRDIGIRRSVFC